MPRPAGTMVVAGVNMLWRTQGTNSTMQTDSRIMEIARARHPDVQAVYRFGSAGTDYERPDSDVDIGLLLPPVTAKRLSPSELMETQTELAVCLGKSVDLLNLRRVSTVMQKEVVMADRRIHTADAYAADEFEMHVLSLYQKLNEERREIIEQGLRSGRFYDI